MKNRKILLTKLVNQVSVLAEGLDSYADFSKIASIEKLRIVVAENLENTGIGAAKSRADFIRKQSDDNFNLNRDNWGIPNFVEDLVTIEDFENGFLWRFRAHTTSWSENQYADQWFYTSLEARSVKRYEFWNCDEGLNKMDFYFEGDYKSILLQLLADHVHEVLISPMFSAKELTDYIDEFSQEEEDYELDDVIEDYISKNPNYKPA